MEFKGICPGCGSINLAVVDVSSILLKELKADVHCLCCDRSFTIWSRPSWVWRGDM